MAEDSHMDTPKGIYLRFYVAEKRRHRGVKLHEWLLEQAVKLALPGA